MFDWNDLRFFLAVQRAGNLSAAARQLRVNQTTVGRRLEALEASLGSRLFERHPTGFVLTPAGEGVREVAERMEGEALALERRAAGEDARLEGLVRLTTLESLGGHFLAPRLAAFHARYPGIRLELVTDSRSLSLTRHEADVALRLARPVQEGLFSRRVGLMGFGVYAAPDYLERAGAPRHPRELAGHARVGLDESLSHVPDALWLAEHGGDSPLVFRSNSVLSLLNAVRGGLGVGVFPCYLAEGDARLRRLFGPEQVVSRELWLAVHADLRRTGRVRVLMDFLVELFRKQAPLLAGTGMPSRAPAAPRRSRS